MECERHRQWSDRDSKGKTKTKTNSNLQEQDTGSQDQESNLQVTRQKLHSNFIINLQDQWAYTVKTHLIT